MSKSNPENRNHPRPGRPGAAEAATTTQQTGQYALAEPGAKSPAGEKIAGSNKQRYVPHHGRTLHRALEQEYVSRSAFADPGVFGRMFPTLPSIVFTRDSLEKLAERMNAADGGEDNPDIPAGYTFLGQFIDHDITFDPTSSLEKENDPEAIHNFRTPLLELDSVYGSGPAASPFLYDVEDGDKLLVGRDEEGMPNDLPRNRQGTALLGDPRNDENLIISQLHLVFLKFHNRVVDHVREKGAEEGFPVPEEMVFAEAQRIVRWHYQWVVLYDFLRRTVGDELLLETVDPHKTGKLLGQHPIGNIYDESLKYFRFNEEPFIPVEFAVAAYRFGHSQIRPGYRVNGEFAGNIFPDLGVGPNLTRDSRVLEAGRSVEWSNFFELDGEGSATPGKRIDAKLSGPLFNLPGFEMKPPSSLALRNLLRGNSFRLPWGQRVAVAMGVTPLTEDELAADGTRLTELGFPPRRAPLWYYVLKEAEKEKGNEGRRLGRVGGRIVAEVLVGLLKGDFKSFLSQDPTWRPFLPSREEGRFDMADLVRFATGA